MIVYLRLECLHETTQDNLSSSVAQNIFLNAEIITVIIVWQILYPSILVLISTFLVAVTGDAWIMARLLSVLTGTVSKKDKKSAAGSGIKSKFVLTFGLRCRSGNRVGAKC